MPYPTIIHAQVIAQDPPFGVRVQLASGAIFGQTVRVLHSGAADGLRVNQNELPGRGTWGLVAIPYGSTMNAVWIGSYYSQQQTAYTGDATDPFLRYLSHFSGAYELLNGAGEWCQSFPDGTFILASGSIVKPTTYRTVVAADQTTQRVPFTDLERIPNPPPPRNLYTRHASGTSDLIDPAGNRTLQGAPDATITIEATGAPITLMANGATIQISAAGAVMATAASGQNVTLTSGGNSVTVSPSETTVTGNLAVSGDATIGNGATGTFTAASGQTITVTNGIVTSIT